MKCMVREKDVDTAIYVGKIIKSRYRYNAEDDTVYLEIIVEKGWYDDKDQCKTHEKRKVYR